MANSTPSGKSRDSESSPIAGNADWYRIANPESLDTPVLIVFPERVKQNIQNAIAMVRDVNRLRPHVKTHKSPGATRLQLAAGITRFKCATIAEAEMLAMEGAPDVLLAYQPIGPKADRLAQLIKKYPGTQFSCLIDNAEAATAMAKTFAEASLTVPVYLDINVGMDRTGIAPGPEAVKLYQLAARTKGLNPIGLHAYDGHIRASDLAERTRQCDDGFAKVEALRAAILQTPEATNPEATNPEATNPKAINPKAVDLLAAQAQAATPKARTSAQPLTIIAGGSPTFPIHANRADEIQCSPGTFVYWDKGYSDGFPDQPFQPAALVLTRVISTRSDTRLCLDLGHKSIAPENELTRRVYFINGPDLKPVGQSEEHLVVETNEPHQVGDIFYGIPYHVCPTVALYDRAITIESGKITGAWKNIARDRSLSI
jgi:D-serine deaminase-like pyridoxal phosphate-dependent protein